ncbi:chorismate synthase [Oerskovia turbata]|uniref:Chorismate synthase n=1 Tax=Oerskovia turbata TaxID=1713 RepID=A0A4Q1KXE4_9CELL|nr:chorismate synthase [Oerskovia turbata]RXR24803.1 chorismate synthase [Oerskovia turbata]RXR34993.1 chorismate synthase [Oerskovia turbata]TGJ97054.1 chorismate synthase [Actinotalea fermentans ATCC 43279 = JCM 9966 = DSM 3133]
MLRWLTSGESHGPALVGILEGLPAGVELVTKDVQDALARRRLGYGRGARMKFEQDEVRILAGLRLGLTQGGPLAIEIGNTEWPKWVDVMSADPVPAEALQVDAGTGDVREIARNRPLTRPRPGHADLIGMRKYAFDDARPVLERASARETATRVALGVAAAKFLEQAVGIRLVSHVVGIGTVDVPEGAALPQPDDVARLDADPVRCFDPASSAAMVAEIDECHKDGDTLGGVVEVLAYGVPSGLGTYVQSDRRLDARLAAVLMGIQAIKGVEVGDGFRTARRRGSQAHDEIVRGEDGHLHRLSNRAGGVEGGMSNGEVLRVRAAMKPISTVPRALATVDVSTGEPAKAQHQRSDVCAVPPAAVVAEAMVALVLAEAVLEKFGGDSVTEVRRNVEGYLASVPELLR